MHYNVKNKDFASQELWLADWMMKLIANSPAESLTEVLT